MFQRYSVKNLSKGGDRRGVGIYIFVTVQTERDLDGSTAFFLYMAGKYTSTMGNS